MATPELRHMLRDDDLNHEEQKQVLELAIKFHRNRFYHQPFAGPLHLHVGLVEGHLTGHPQEAPQAPFVNQGIVPQLVELLFRQVLEAAVGEAAHLTEVGLLEPVVDGHGDGEEGRVNMLHFIPNGIS